MIISCPQCTTKYRLSGEKVKPEGTRVRCSRCKHEFTTFPGDDLSATLWAGDQADQGASRESPTDADRYSAGPEADEQTRPGKKKKSRGPLLLVLILILLLGAGGYLYWPRITSWLPFLSSGPNTDIHLSHKAAESGLTEGIALQDVRQYMVDNQSMGRILVIEGRAVNTSQTAKRAIKVQATLFDDQGRTLVSRDVLCGNTASVYQLQNLARKDLQEVLTSQAGILANNSHLAPEQDVVFMTFFPQVPEQVAEFSLKVVQARGVQTSKGQG